ncbi:hypothetical protein FGIG_10202 [Fasciola gigantica]|uniref:Uncharacterized protein n=1 Tax=Fasciola gigantica TaxID=46835 RepID=A0A504YFL8_FASGI|nr:hypothetical protein FGIG_10202 [Fasciola gigantica]
MLWSLSNAQKQEVIQIDHISHSDKNAFLMCSYFEVYLVLTERKSLLWFSYRDSGKQMLLRVYTSDGAGTPTKVHIVCAIVLGYLILCQNTKANLLSSVTDAVAPNDTCLVRLDVTLQLVTKPSLMSKFLGWLFHWIDGTKGGMNQKTVNIENNLQEGNYSSNCFVVVFASAANTI